LDVLKIHAFPNFCNWKQTDVQNPPISFCGRHCRFKATCCLSYRKAALVEPSVMPTFAVKLLIIYSFQSGRHLARDKIVRFSQASPGAYSLSDFSIHMFMPIQQLCWPRYQPSTDVEVRNIAKSMLALWVLLLSEFYGNFNFATALSLSSGLKKASGKDCVSWNLLFKLFS
jgi:hypothetical protein